MTALICGSFAFDTIMVFPDKFVRHILPDKLHILNVSFMVPSMRREFGGCAGNIAYNLNALGGQALPMGTVGEDFLPYAQWMDRHGIARTYVTEVSGTYTAQAFITTDLDDNQITAFHPGAMAEAHRNRVADAAGVTLGIVSPDGRQGMIDHARQFAEAGIPFIFDPGQGLPMFDGPELLSFVDQADYVCVNDYEAGLLADRTGLDVAALADRTRAFIVTKGAEGSEIRANGRVHCIPAVRAEKVCDPTGCGDAYRAGILFGLGRGLDWETTGRVAALLGSMKIEYAGTQNHKIDPEAFKERFAKVFGYRMT
ncbi:carbohydrate kinase family protein [Acidiferrobacter sp.]|uniref:carbohydrate kinase family protein n=1 Tax=Acidiferrobacter sp. TaxID=1872107 RepID=UPI002616F795|nr:carbohydrate kinase family protein [Acidiferrobacter sp.]